MALLQQGMMTIPSGLTGLLRRARRWVVLTGAGISAESGVPTFRQAQRGLWQQYRPEELATPGAFAQNPRRVWEWYAWRHGLVAAACPNPAHQALVALEREVEGFTLITQNVDGLHQRAGSQHVLELHGSLQRARCTQGACGVFPWPELGEALPNCPHCGAVLRPDIVWFGEALPASAVEEAEKAARACEVFLSVGTSSVVYPAANLPYAALHSGATVVEVNLEPTPLSGQAQYVLRGAAGKVLPVLVAALKSSGKTSHDHADLS